MAGIGGYSEETAMQASKVKEQGAIQQALEETNCLLTDLDMGMERLVKKLIPVMSPKPVSPDNEPEPGRDSGREYIIDNIHDKNYRIKKLIKAIDSVRNQIDL